MAYTRKRKTHFKKTRKNAFKKKHHLRKTKKGGLPFQTIGRVVRKGIEKGLDFINPSTQALGKNTSVVSNSNRAEQYKPDSPYRYTNLKKGSIVPTNYGENTES